MDELKKNIENGFSESYLYGEINDIKQNLSDYGVNLDKNRERQNKLIKQLKFKLNISINKEKNEDLLNKATKTFQNAINKGLDKPITYLNQLIKANQLSVQYNRLDKLSSDEIKDIIKDQNLIEIIELIEEKE